MTHSLLPSSEILHSEYGKDLAVWCVLSIVLLLSPTLVRGPAAGHPGHAVALPAGRSVLNVQMGSCPALCAGAGGGEYNSLCHSVLAQGPLQFAACGLDGIWGGRPLVQLDLRHLSAGAGGADFGPVPGGRRADGLSLPVQRQLHRHASEGGPPVRGGGGRAGLLASGSALHVPPLWDGYGPWVPKGAEAVAAAVLLALGLGLCALACRRQRKRELL